MIFVCLIVFLSEIVSPQVRGGAIGLYRTFMDAGGFVGPIIMLFAYNNFGPISSFLLAMAILITNVILMATLRVRKNM